MSPCFWAEEKISLSGCREGWLAERRSLSHSHKTYHTVFLHVALPSCPRRLASHFSGGLKDICKVSAIRVSAELIAHRGELRRDSRLALGEDLRHMLVQPSHFMSDGILRLFHLLIDQLQHVLFFRRNPCGRTDGLLRPRASGHGVNNAPKAGINGARWRQKGRTNCPKKRLSQMGEHGCRGIGRRCRCWDGNEG